MQHTGISTPIRISCDVTDTLPLASMTDFQGELKVRTAGDYDKIFSSMQKYGIAFPFFVWINDSKYFILDGHGRVEALRRAASTGYIVPELPVIYIQAADETTAKNLLLHLNSRYGTITVDGIREFIDGHDIDLDEVNIPELPDLSAALDAMLDDMPEPDDDPDKAEFIVFCPECGERLNVTDEELEEVVRDED